MGLVIGAIVAGAGYAASAVTAAGTAVASTAVAAGTAIAGSATASAIAVGAATYGAVALSGGFDKSSGDNGSAAIAESRRIEEKAKQAEIVAEQKARDDAREQLRRRTRTIFTSGIGVLGIKDKDKNTILGA